MSEAASNAAIKNISANDSERHISASELTHELDPNILQRKASTPENSVWVSASAGTGKTKVLTDRVLRLLLPKPKAR